MKEEKWWEKNKQINVDLQRDDKPTQRQLCAENQKTEPINSGGGFNQ